LICFEQTNSIRVINFNLVLQLKVCPRAKSATQVPQYQ
ncbi:unnamed protein product, partial [Amoebophrya sp. A120]